MRFRLAPASLLIVVGVLGLARSVEAQCEPDGDVQFVCGPVSPEDLVAVPESPWVIVSGMEDDGYVYATDTRDHHSMVLFPTETVQTQPAASFSDCAGPSTEAFRPHGLSLRPGDGGRHTLYVVRHGAREAIEVFDLDIRAAVPSLTWRGCAVAPDGVTFNSVAALPGGGFAATHLSPPTGELWEWQPDKGWGHGTRQRDQRAQRAGRLTGWPLVLHRRVGQSVVDSALTRTDAGADGFGRGRLSHRQCPVGT